MVRAEIIKDDIKGVVYWDITWIGEKETLLSAAVDAEKGVVLGVYDSRLARVSKVDNIKSSSKAVEIARGLLERLGVNISQLSNPVVKLDVIQVENGPMVIYSINWPQIYQGLRIREGFISVMVNAEKEESNGSCINLINVNGIDISPIIQRDKAVESKHRFYKVIF